MELSTHYILLNTVQWKVDTVGERRNLGVLVSMDNGKATNYGLHGSVEDRGVMFIEPGAACLRRYDRW